MAWARCTTEPPEKGRSRRREHHLADTEENCEIGHTPLCTILYSVAVVITKSCFEAFTWTGAGCCLLPSHLLAEVCILTGGETTARTSSAPDGTVQSTRRNKPKEAETRTSQRNSWLSLFATVPGDAGTSRNESHGRPILTLRARLAM